MSKRYGEQTLFRDLSLHINQGERIALVAKNGTGKSTLLQIISGLLSPDTGSVTTHRELNIVYQKQQDITGTNKTAKEFILDIDLPAVQALKNYKAAIETQQDSTLKAALIQMEEHGGWQIESDINQLLGKLRIDHLQQTNISTLSGGELKRMTLAKSLLLANSYAMSLLLLDEPTNHLDTSMIEWLENYLKKSSSSLLLVTHDRYFLDTCCQTIWELEEETCHIYKGNYDYYLEHKALYLEEQTSRIEKAQNTFRKELDWMRRQPKARTTKSKARIDRFYEVEKQASKKITTESLHLDMQPTRLGGKIVELMHAEKMFGERPIFKKFSYAFQREDRIGIVGKNGAGKTTLLNILYGSESLSAGKRTVGETVLFGYYTQRGLTIKKDMRVIEYVKQIAEFFPLAKGKSLSATQFLERFLFPACKQYTYLSKLSGGELKRLQLLTVLFRNPNFLLLDEPTNDLDLPTLRILEQFLQDFAGCIVVVSHDRYFIDQIATHLLICEEDKTIRVFEGSYSQYLVQAKKQKNKKDVLPTGNPEIEKNNNALSYKTKRKVGAIEKELASLEKKKYTIDAELKELSNEFSVMQEKTKELSSVLQHIKKLEDKWLELQS